MINKDRIVPVTAIDLLTLYKFIIGRTGTFVIPLETIDAVNVSGDFTVTASNLVTKPNLFCSEPVKSFDITGSDSDMPDTANVYFVPGYNYTGFTFNGEALDVIGADSVVADGKTLYWLLRTEGEYEVKAVLI